MTTKFSRSLIGITFAVTFLAGCGDDDAPAATGSASAPAAKAQSTGGGKGSPLLAYVPADTPYFVGNRDTMDNKTVDLMWSMAEPGLSYIDNAISQALDDEKVSDDPLAKAVMEELSGKMNRQGMADLGFDPAGNAALYGLGVLPVLRADLADGNRLRETISRIEAKAGQEFVVNNFEGQDFYENGDEKAKVIVAINDDELVMSVVPSNAREAGLKQLFSDNKPASNITGRLDDVNDEYNLLPMFTMMMNPVGFVDAMLTDNSEVASAMFADGRQALGPECAAEFREIAGIMPQIVSGYTAFNDSAVDSIAVMKLRDDIATATKELAAPMGGMGSIDDVLLHLGFAIDVLKTKQFLSDQANAVAADPYQCAELAELNDGMAQMSAQLAQPLPPMVGNFQGFRFSLKEMDLSSGMPQNLRALLMVGITNPQLVVGMASAMVPQLANLQMTTDGTPTPLPAGLIPFPLDGPHLAMTEQGIGLSTGTGEETELKGYLSGDAASGDLPFLVMGYDEEGMALYQQQIQQAMASMAPDEDMPELPMSDLFSRQTISASFTDRGLEMFSKAYLEK
ncbi:MAG: hypothetical protein AB8B96_10720 [Lysobacterales bacterium]